jgi:hypothetical protein
VAAHQAVEETSKRMWQQVKRRNYVTPTSYLETVRGYRALLLEKLGALQGKADKLRGGLTKLEETAEQVLSCCFEAGFGCYSAENLLWLPGCWTGWSWGCCPARPSIPLPTACRWRP